MHAHTHAHTFFLYFFNMFPICLFSTSCLVFCSAFSSPLPPPPPTTPEVVFYMGPSENSGLE